MDILDYGEEAVSVAMEEIKPQDWAKHVYQPDIVGKPGLWACPKGTVQPVHSIWFGRDFAQLPFPGQAVEWDWISPDRFLR